MAEISEQLANALRRGDAPLLLFYMDHPSAGVIRAHSRTGILTIDGVDWIGFGLLGRISGATRSVKMEINQVVFEVRGVPPTTTTYLSGKVRNKVAKVWRAAIDKRGRVTVDDDPMIEALLDNQTLSVDDDTNTAIIRITGIQGFYTLDRAQDIAFSNEQQVSEYPDDTGLSLVHTFEQRESNWRKEDPPAGP